MGKSPFLMGKSPFLMGKSSTINDHFHRSSRQLRFFHFSGPGLCTEGQLKVLLDLQPDVLHVSVVITCDNLFKKHII